MFRLILNRSLRPIVDRKPSLSSLSALLGFEVILKSRQKQAVHFGRAAGHVACKVRLEEITHANLDMTSVDLSLDPATLWARNEQFASQRDADQFVKGVFQYLKSTGGRGGEGLVNRLYKCLQQVRKLHACLQEGPFRHHLLLDKDVVGWNRRIKHGLCPLSVTVWSKSAQTLSTSLTQTHSHMLF